MPVMTEAHGGASVAAVTWRAEGEVRVTAVVKATFALAPGGRVMTRGATVPLEPFDLVPQREYVDVVLQGSACSPFGQPASRVSVRLVIVPDEGAPSLDKTVEVTSAVPFQLVPFTAMGRASNPGEAQSAPRDQQIASVTGTERVIVERMHPALPRVETRLPNATAAARLIGPGGTRAYDLRLDTVLVEMDKLACSLVWRGYLPADQETPLEALKIAAGVALPGEVLALAPVQPRTLAAGSETRTIGPEETGRLRAAKAMPFGPTTQTLSPSDVADARAVLPFVASAAPRPPLDARRAPPVHQDTGTRAMDSEQVSRIRAALVSAHEAPGPPPPPLQRVAPPPPPMAPPPIARPPVVAPPIAPPPYAPPVAPQPVEIPALAEPREEPKSPDIAPAPKPTEEKRLSPTERLAAKRRAKSH